jgi:2',3'-cyclic-nucleotide 2'-phosphodiesterase
LYNSSPWLLRPANYAKAAPGKGYAIAEINGYKILLVSLIGQVFMSLDFNNPFAEIDEILSNLANNNLSAIIVDIHAEATSEKIGLFHYLDGRASAILGTHTHVMTADAQISPSGTALITDVGMTGFKDGVLGVEKAGIINTFLTQIKNPHVIPEAGPAILNAIYLKIDPKTKKTVAIKPITKTININ